MGGVWQFDPFKTDRRKSLCEHWTRWKRARFPARKEPATYSGRLTARAIGFFAEGKLKRVSLDGQPPQTLCPAEDARGGAWSSSGVILFSAWHLHIAVPGSGNWRYTGASHKAARSQYRGPLPGVSAGWAALFFFKAADTPEVNGVYVSSLADLRDRTEPVRLIGDNTNVAYVPGGAQTQWAIGCSGTRAR